MALRGAKTRGGSAMSDKQRAFVEEYLVEM